MLIIGPHSKGKNEDKWTFAMAVDYGIYDLHTVEAKALINAGLLSGYILQNDVPLNETSNFK